MDPRAHDLIQQRLAAMNAAPGPMPQNGTPVGIPGMAPPPPPQQQPDPSQMPGIIQFKVFHRPIAEAGEMEEEANAWLWELGLAMRIVGIHYEIAEGEIVAIYTLRVPV
jgi:hypothetical protein